VVLILMLDVINWLEEGPRKWGGIGAEWVKSAFVYAVMLFIGQKHKYHREQHKSSIWCE
jgi:hypothetical protein